MLVYLIRHADAVDADEDAARPLSERGRAQVRTLAGVFARGDVFCPDEIWHSSLLRSRQTAEILAQRLKLRAPLLLMPDLEPEDDPRAVARRIKVTPRCLAVVGHEPHLSGLASFLIAGRAEPPVFLMKKSSALGLEGAGEHWCVRWHISPEIIG